MEMTLVVIATHNCTISNGCGQLNRQLLEGFNPRVEWKETRSSYSLNVHFPEGFRREDISLEMDNTRALLIRGQAGLEGLGMVAWTWHLMERNAGRSFRRPFKIPHNVNVGSITGSFHQGVLHVEMPKRRWNRFSPYDINGSTRNRHHYDPPLQVPDQAYQLDPTVQDVPDELRTRANELIGHDNTEAQIRGAGVTADHSDSHRLMPHCPEEKDRGAGVTVDHSDSHRLTPHCPEEKDRGAGVTADHSDSHRLMPHCPEEKDRGAGVTADHSDSHRLMPHCPEEKDTTDTSEDASSIPSVDNFPESSSSGSLSSPEEENCDLKSLIEEMKEFYTPSQNLQDHQQHQPPDPCPKDEEEELGKIVEEVMKHQAANHEEKSPLEADDHAANSQAFNGMESIVEQEAIRAPNSDAKEENSVEKVIPPNSRDLVEKDADERAIDTHDLFSNRFLSKTKTKIVLSVIVSAVAIMAARKLMRRS